MSITREVPKLQSESSVDFLTLIEGLPGKLVNKNGLPVPDFEGESYQVGERQLNVRTTGAHDAAKRSAVYVHGLGGASTNWTDLMFLLAPVANGYAPDLPGFGRSPLPVDQDYSLAAHTATMIRFIEDRFDEPVDLFGNSMGGAISIRIAGSRPDLVRSLTLISPAVPNLRPRPGAFQVALMAAPGVAELTRLAFGQPSPQQAVERMHSLVYKKGFAEHPLRLESQIKQAAWRMDNIDVNEPLICSARGLTRSFLPGHSENTWRFAREIQAPTLAFFGTEDILVDPRMAIPTARNINNSTVITLDTAHVAQLERPVDVARYVLEQWMEQSWIG